MLALGHEPLKRHVRDKSLEAAQIAPSSSTRSCGHPALRARAKTPAGKGHLILFNAFLVNANPTTSKQFINTF